MVITPSKIRVACFSALLCASALSAAPVFAQSADLSAQYSTVLDQIADEKLRIAQREVFVAQQEARIATLQNEIAAVGPIKAGFDEMLGKAVTQLKNSVNSDLPFLVEERRNRIDALQTLIEDPTASAAEKYRRLLTALKIEAEYGVGVEAMEASRPINSGETQVMTVQVDEKGEVVKDPQTGEGVVGPEQGTMLRYGRVGLVYMNLNATSARRWDVKSQSWVDVGGGELLNIRRAIRVAKGESAPAVVTAPVYLSE